jgi:hypothetical protein
MSSRKKRKAQQEEDCAVCIIHSAKSNNENLVSYSVDCFEKLLDINGDVLKAQQKFLGWRMSVSKSRLLFLRDWVITGIATISSQ